MPEEQRVRRIGSKWLLLMVMWAAYAAIVVIAMITGQPETIIKSLLSAEVFGGLTFLTVVAIFFA